MRVTASVDHSSERVGFRGIVNKTILKNLVYQHSLILPILSADNSVCLRTAVAKPSELPKRGNLPARVAPPSLVSNIAQNRQEVCFRTNQLVFFILPFSCVFANFKQVLQKFLTIRSVPLFQPIRDCLLNHAAFVRRVRTI